MISAKCEYHDKEYRVSGVRRIWTAKCEESWLYECMVWLIENGM
jgi:hypothetical protein